MIPQPEIETEPEVETYLFRARVCLVIAAVGFLIFLAGMLMSVF